MSAIIYKDTVYGAGAGAGGGGASALADLTDVDLSNLADGQIIKYDATNQKWVNDDESGGLSELNYSTEEQKIGKWIDGKPIYQKVITGLNKNVNQSSYNSVMDVSDLHIDMIMPQTAGYQNSLGNWRVGYWDVTHTANTLTFYPFHNGTINIIILVYTKTTD